MSLPLAISFLRPAAVIEPSGKESCAAISSRNGVLSVIAAGSTIFAFI
jgi:hypothetical protein